MSLGHVSVISELRRDAKQSLPVSGEPGGSLRVSAQRSERHVCMLTCCAAVMTARPNSRCTLPLNMEASRRLVALSHIVCGKAFLCIPHTQVSSWIDAHREVSCITQQHHARNPGTCSDKFHHDNLTRHCAEPIRQARRKECTIACATGQLFPLHQTVQPNRVPQNWELTADAGWQTSSKRGTSQSCRRDAASQLAALLVKLLKVRRCAWTLHCCP